MHELFMICSRLVHDFSWLAHCHEQFHNLLLSYLQPAELLVLLWPILVNNLFIICSWRVHEFLMICLWLVHNLSTTRSLLVYDFFKLFTNCLYLGYDLFKTCSRLVHDLFKTYQWLIHNLLMNSSRVVLDFFVTCS